MWPSPVTGVSHGVAAGSEIEHQRRDIQKASLLKSLGVAAWPSKPNLGSHHLQDTLLAASMSLWPAYTQEQGSETLPFDED